MYILKVYEYEDITEYLLEINRDDYLDIMTLLRNVNSNRALELSEKLRKSVVCYEPKYLSVDD